MFEEGFLNPRHVCTNGGGERKSSFSVFFSNQNVQNINIIFIVNNVLPERMEVWIKSENNEVKECLIGFFTSEFRIVFTYECASLRGGETVS